MRGQKTENRALRFKTSNGGGGGGQKTESKYGLDLKFRNSTFLPFDGVYVSVCMCVCERAGEWRGGGSKNSAALGSVFTRYIFCGVPETLFRNTKLAVLNFFYFSILPFDPKEGGEWGYLIHSNVYHY